MPTLARLKVGPPSPAELRWRHLYLDPATAAGITAYVVVHYRLPRVRVTLSTRRTSRRLGTWRWRFRDGSGARRYRILLYRRWDCRRWEVSTLLHELAHHKAHWADPANGGSHGEDFHRAFDDIAALVLDAIWTNRFHTH